MASWRHLSFLDSGLRGAGLIVSALGLMALAWVIERHGAGGLAYVLATAGFFGVCIGGALVSYGRHLFDVVEVSARWRRPNFKGRTDA